MDNSLDLQSTLTRFHKVRAKTLDLVKDLDVEDMVVQPNKFVSPIKWHLAHTTWFFENFIVKKYSKNFKDFDDKFNYLFNSYYNGVGNFNPKEKRGLILRPGLRTIYNYRESIDDSIEKLIIQNSDDINFISLIELGINHEQQHQELILMDILNIYFNCSLSLIYEKSKTNINDSNFKSKWTNKKVNFEYGSDGKSFSYDNEKPSGLIELRPYSLDINFVTNNDWMEFIKDDGYKRPEFWFSDGWDYINHNKISRPLYWLDNNYRYSLRGVEKIKPYQPVSHISFYEANAYSKYRNKRLPTEFELEFFLKSNDKNGNFLDSKLLCPVGFSSRDQNINSYGNLWCWTSSNYTPFRNFTPFFGKLNEYNEKFYVINLF